VLLIQVRSLGQDVLDCESSCESRASHNIRYNVSSMVNLSTLPRAVSLEQAVARLEQQAKR